MNPSAPEPVPVRAPELGRSEPPQRSPATPSPDGVSKPRHIESAQRVKEIAWTVAQGVLFLSFLVVAVVLGRGGTLAALSREVREGFGAAGTTGGLTVEDVRVTRRALAGEGAGAVVIVTGVVCNRTDTLVPGARVEVHFVLTHGDGARAQSASGWAWSGIDGVDIDTLMDAPASLLLSQRSPRSASLAPGDRAPFIVVAPAPAEGTKATVTVSATAPPAPPPPPALKPAPTPARGALRRSPRALKPSAPAAP